MSDDQQIEAAITAYRARLQAEAEIGKSDLAEIEDHLRDLVAELRATGVLTADAITLAAHRLGEPAELAREHARVRSPFGAKLSPIRAVSAAVLVTAQVVLALTLYAPVSVMTQLVLPAIVIGALALRLTWARALIVGMAGYSLLDHLVWIVLMDRVELGTSPAVLAAFLVMSAGTFAFVAPWRRRELAPAGIALVALYPAFAGAMQSFAFELTGQADLLVLPYLALGATMIAACGLVLRARWGAIAAGVASVALVGAGAQLGDTLFHFDDALLIEASILVTIGVGAAAALVTAVLAWRTARSTLGTLKSILS